MENYVLYDDEELMLEIKADNMFAFDILYKKYSKRLYKFGYSIIKSREETENLVQDVYLNLWEHRYKVQKNSSIKYYLFTIAYNSAISIIKKKAKESQYFEYIKSLQENIEESVNVELEYNELKKKYDEIIKELPLRQKEIFYLHRIEGLKYKEISNRLNISINTVENQMSRALKTIRAKIDNYFLFAILFFFLCVE